MPKKQQIDGTPTFIGPTHTPNAGKSYGFELLQGSLGAQPFLLEYPTHKEALQARQELLDASFKNINIPSHKALQAIYAALNPDHEEGVPMSSRITVPPPS